MPKGKHHHGGGGGSKRKERAVRAAYRQERKAGAYLCPGDPDFKSFSNQLAVQGLTLRDVPGDGNCLFRALALQLGDRLLSHTQLRRDVVQYMREHRDDFEPFIEDQTPFEQYVTELARDCEFAGNDAIVAFARAYSTNVVIHQHNAPRLEVLSQQHGGSLSQQCRGSPHTLHIAYLNGEHYCSVETMLPSEDLPAATQIPPVRVGGGPRTMPSSPIRSRGGPSLEAKTVLEATGCLDLELVEQSLCENSYDPELAIVEVLQLMSFKESGAAASFNETHNSIPQSLGGESIKKQVQAKKKSEPQSGRRLSNKDRRAAAKAARKQTKRETVKTVVLQSDPVGSTAI
ncbi:OTU domain-containing protein 3-like isoform X3 [Halichondria panicea]|uniref:OTU domain-containing protein 3-like isoform X3 n=1 Tax=Halichondria panicea TaxID=6063 RepID=UPI00312B5313